eukprot:9974737-Ditylum_brightwellii.AAC.1
MDTSSVPVEKAVECVVLQAGNCVCLPTRCKAVGQSHPFVICNSLCGGGRVHTCRFLEPSWDFLGNSSDLEYKGTISHPYKAGSAMCV